MEMVKMQIDVTPEVAEYITSNSTPKGKGKFVSKIISEYTSIFQDVAQPEQETGIFERMDQRLQSIESKLAYLVARFGESEGE